MAEIKNVFTSGRMNKDLDERQIPNGEYRDALNIQIANSEGSDVGAVENLLGNIQLSSLPLVNPKVIGAISYTLKDKIYWFVSSNEIDGIYEFDANQNVTSPILIDTKETLSFTFNQCTVEANADNELVLNDIPENDIAAVFGAAPKTNLAEALVNNNIDLSSTSPFVSISIPKGTIIRLENKKYVFKNIEYSGKAYGNVELKADYTKGSILNFSKNNLITGINIIDGILFWTDNLNPPRRINISKFKKYSSATVKSGSSYTRETKIQYDYKPANGPVETLYRDLRESDISVAKKAPLRAPKIALSSSLRDNDQVQIKVKHNFFSNSTYNQQTGETNASSGEVSAIARVGDNIVLKNLDYFPTWKEGDVVEITEEQNSFSYTASVKSLEKITQSGEIKRQIVLTLLTKDSITDPEDQEYEIICTLKESDPIFEKTFVRFAYRWKYADGEYSTISPFSEPAFLHKRFLYDGNEAYNFAMLNNVRKITLSDPNPYSNLTNTNESWLGEDTVAEIEILFKEARNQNIYTLESTKRIDFPSKVQITKKQIHSVLENEQLLRQWDNVPKKAKAQEVSSNRIIYGNYTQNYDVYSQPKIRPRLKRRVGNTGRTVKSNRTYQVGVVYMDEYNRHTPVQSNQSGTIRVPHSESIYENQLSVKLSHPAPAWATHFKYYIKDTAAEYYNLACDKIYQDDENGFAYVSFPSSERNKITENTYLTLKKQHGSDEAVTDSDNNRFKVIDIFNEPPDFVAEKKKEILELSNIVFNASFTSTTSQLTKLGGGTPVAGASTFNVRNSNNFDDNDFKTSDDDRKEIKPGRLIRFKYNKKYSNYYEIASVRFSTKNAFEITIKTSFKDDVNIIYDADDNVLGADANGSDIAIEIYEKQQDKGAKAFDGRFFVKLRNNSVLKNNIVTFGDDEEYFARTTFATATEKYVNSGVRLNRGGGPSRDPSMPAIIILPHRDAQVPSLRNGKNWHITFQSSTVDGVVRANARNLFKKFDKIQFKLKYGEEDTLSDIYTIGDIFIERNADGLDDIYLHLTDDDGNEKELQYELFNLPASNLTGHHREEWSGDIEVNILALVEDSEDIFVKNPAIFETEPIDNPTDLNIYYETDRAFPISVHGAEQTLEWFNAFSFKNGVESNRIRDDFNGVYIGTGVKASSTISQQIREEHKFNGLIWSGVMNSRSGLNASNQFNIANPITKDILPAYGAIQKLYTWANRLTIFCEDKIVSALADKDQLYNADGSSNIIASNNVIGSINEYAGDFGISDIPESFAVYGFRVYFADRMRGVILRLSNDGLTVISRNFMTDFFRDRFFEKGCFHQADQKKYFIGSFDEYNKLYNLSFEGKDTVCFSEGSNGWVTRKSFIPEWALSLNNKYYTFYQGDIWMHDTEDAKRNNFYGTQYNSSIEFEMNQDPSVVKRYKTLGYEGTKDWKATINTDQQKSSEISFIDKENKFFAFIKGESQNYKNLDAKNFSVQGIGSAASIGSMGAISDTSITFSLNPSEGTYYTSSPKVITQAPGKKLENPVEITVYPKKGWTLNAHDFKLKNVEAVKDGDNLILRYTHGEKIQPTEDKEVKLDLCYVNFAEKKLVTKSGTITIITPPGVKATGDGLGNYDATGEAGEVVVLGEVTFEADEDTDLDELIDESAGFTFEEKQEEEDTSTNVSEDPGTNSDENVTDVKDGSTEVDENEDTGGISTDGGTETPSGGTKTKTLIIKTTIGEDDEDSADGGAEMTSTEAIKDKFITLAQIPRNNLSFTEEKRYLVIRGEEGAVFSYKVNDGSSDIASEKNLIMDSTQQYFKQITFPAGTTDKTYTITTEVGNNTKFTDGFLTSPITINRIGKATTDTNIIVKLSYSGGDVVKKATFTTDKGGSNVYDFAIKLDGLTTGLTWIKKKSWDISSLSDIYLDGKLVNSVSSRFFITNSNKLTVDATNGSITLAGKLMVALAGKPESQKKDVDFVFDLGKIVSQERTVTFAYNKTTTGGTATTGYTVTDPSTTTATGPAGRIPTSLEGTYRFKLSPESGKEFITGITPDDFVLVDASNNDVLDVYSRLDDLAVNYDNDDVYVTLWAKNFIMPDAASTTISIRPTKQIAQTTAVEARFFLTANKLSGYEFNSLYNGTLRLGPMESEADQEHVYIYDVSLDKTENFRSIPANYKYIIPTTGNTDSNLTDFSPSGFGAVTTTGAATKFDGTSITIDTGDGIVPSSDGKSAKIQVKGNLYSSLSTIEGSFNFKLALEESYSTRTIQRIVTKPDGTQILQDKIVRVYNKDKDEEDIVKGSYITDEDGEPLNGGNGVLTDHKDHKVKDKKILLTLESNGSIDRVKDLEVYEDDLDNDGIPDHLDTDRDGDGVLDINDKFPDDPNESSDLDNDGIGDNADTDRDGDGVNNDEDFAPDDADETVDSDGDGIGDNADTDDDNDGVLDTDDAFRTDASESVDTDGDGIGDNLDTDDDNDGVSDADDAFRTDSTETTDTDGDGIGDNTDTDIDGDGVDNDEDADAYDANIKEAYYLRIENISNPNDLDNANITSKGGIFTFRVVTNVPPTHKNPDNTLDALGYSLIPVVSQADTFINYPRFNAPGANIQINNNDVYGSNGTIKINATGVVIGKTGRAISANSFFYGKKGSEFSMDFSPAGIIPTGGNVTNTLNNKEFTLFIPENDTDSTKDLSITFRLAQHGSGGNYLFERTDIGDIKLALTQKASSASDLAALNFESYWFDADALPQSPSFNIRSEFSGGTLIKGQPRSVLLYNKKFVPNSAEQLVVQAIKNGDTLNNLYWSSNWGQQINSIYDVTSHAETLSSNIHSTGSGLGTNILRIANNTNGPDYAKITWKLTYRSTNRYAEPSWAKTYKEAIEKSHLIIKINH